MKNYNKLNEFYDMIKKKNIIFYSGPITQEAIESFSKILLQKFRMDSLELSLSQSIFSIYVELTQNILNYSADKTHLETIDGHMSYGIFSVSNTDDPEVYCVMSGNLITKENSAALKEFLNSFSDLSEDKLKELYRQKLLQNLNTVCSGAGLGLIEIAIQSNNQIDYNFMDAGDDFDLFIIIANVGGKKNHV